MFSETLFRLRFSASDLRGGYGHASIQDKWTYRNSVRKHFLRLQYLKTDISTKQSKWIFYTDICLLIDTQSLLDVRKFNEMVSAFPSVCW